MPRKISLQQQEEIMRRVLAGEMAQRLAAEYDISKSLISKWRKNYTKSGENHEAEMLAAASNLTSNTSNQNRVTLTHPARNSQIDLAAIGQYFPRSSSHLIDPPQALESSLSGLNSALRAELGSESQQDGAIEAQGASLVTGQNTAQIVEQEQDETQRVKHDATDTMPSSTNEDSDNLLRIQGSSHHLVCSGHLESTLESRVNHRAATKSDAKRIKEILEKNTLISIEVCSWMNQINELTPNVFAQEDADLLILDDTEWNSRTQWLEGFVSSLPPFLQSQRFTEPTKNAIRKTKDISGLQDLYSRFEALDLPVPIQAFIRVNRARGLSQTSEDQELQKTQISDASQSETGGAKNKQGSEDLVCDNRALPDLTHESQSDQGDVSQISTSVPAEKRNSVQGGAIQGGNAHDISQSAAGEESVLSSPQNRDAMLLLNLTNTHRNEIDEEDWCSLVGIVHRLVPNHASNLKGVSGTIQATPLIKLLSNGHKALQTEHDANKITLVDVGCSHGHVLWAAALSGRFEDVWGIELPDNKEIITNVSKEFKSRASKNSSLRSFSKQFEDVRFCWRDCGKDSEEDLSAILGETSIPYPAMLYWFCTGWDRSDVQNCARMISRSPGVLCVVCLPREQGNDAVSLLLELNSSPGQKRFRMHLKKTSVCMAGGKSSFTAYIFLRSREFEFNLRERPIPVRGQRVEVVFKSPLKWYSGTVKSFKSSDRKGKIHFDADETEGDFELGAPDVIFLPTEDNQWRPAHSDDVKVHLPGRKRHEFCTLCTDSLCHEADNRWCVRCGVTGYHLRCLHGPAPVDFLCPYCRAELANIGRAQSPQFLTTTSPASRRCFGCYSQIFQVGRKIQSDHCKFCNAVFGYCCSSRISSISDITLQYSCPACIGVSGHDTALKYCFESFSERLRKILISSEPITKSQKRISEDALFMDDFARAFNSLQESCQWEIFEETLPGAMEQLRHQVGKGDDPSMGPFQLLNLMGMADGPDLGLYNDASKLYAKHAKDKALAIKNAISSAVTVTNRARATGFKIGYVTADMRLTPWWQLSKVMLLELARRKPLFIFSRPRIELPDGDPHYKALKELCTIIDFTEETSDKAIAECICTHKLDVCIDAGGPTFGSFTGVMGLLAEMQPRILRGAHLGYPGAQPGGHIEFSVVDQYVLTPGGPQAEKAEEALMFMSCYQPNDSWRSSVSVVAAAPTDRSHWNLPDGKFVFGYFCRLGRISRRLAEAFASILRRAPDSVLWIRNTPLFANLRVRQLLLEKGISADRVFSSCDVPNEEHRERLGNADLCLDSDIYGGHTTASDSLLRGVPYLALEGDWWHGRVSASLIRNLMGSLASELVCSNLKEFEDRAVFLATSGAEKLNLYRTTLREKMEQKEGICNGDLWIREFEAGLAELIRQKQVGTPLTDVFLCKAINEATTRRKRTFLDVQANEGHGKEDGSRVALQANEGGTQAERDRSTASALKRKSDSNGGAQDAKRRKACSNLSDDVADRMDVSGEEADHDSGNGPVEQGSTHSRRGGKAASYRLEWLFQLAQKDPHGAREEAYEYLMQDMPEGRKIARIEKPDGTFMWAIQLPCKVPRVKSFNVSAFHGETEYPLLYMTESVPGRGSDLCAGQDFPAGMYHTCYDGKLMDSKDVKDPSHAISTGYSEKKTVDSGPVPDHVLVEKCALGGKVNHGSKSNVKFVWKDWRGPVSGHTKSIYIQARKDGCKHTLLLANYTPSAALRDHGIPSKAVPVGTDYITGDAYGRNNVKSPVTGAMEVLRTKAGLDLMRIRGGGSQGLVVEVRSAGSDGATFVVKIGKKPFDSSPRLGLLAEAALMLRIERQQASIGTFSSELCPVFEGGDSCVALLSVDGKLIPAVAMESADSDASQIWRDLGKRFLKGEDGELLQDQRSLLRGTIQATAWMHASGYAHGDLKPDNILLKRLSERPVDSLVAWCEVKNVAYQILIGDWGHARWSGLKARDFHVFSHSDGKSHSCAGLTPMHRESIQGIKRRTLSTAFGFRKESQVFTHPGRGTVTFRAPEFNRHFNAGQGSEQRRFDQAGDMWALGVISVRVLAPPKWEKGIKRTNADDLYVRDRTWADYLRQNSRRGEGLRVVQQGPAAAGRGVQAVLTACVDAEDRGFWIATMVHKRYQGDRWPVLLQHMSGGNASCWKSLLDLQQGLLKYNSDHRLTAEQALQHDFIKS